jgi:predicted transcriptional regulator
MSLSKKQRRDLIQIRRERVLQLLSQGQMNQSTIAQTLHVSEPTVSRDSHYIRRQSQEALKTHIQETVPMEYALAMSGLRRVLWETNKIIADEKLDSRTKLQALQLLAAVHKDMFALTADGVTVDRALEKLQRMSTIANANVNDNDREEQEQQSQSAAEAEAEIEVDTESIIDEEEEEKESEDEE